MNATSLYKAANAYAEKSVGSTDLHSIEVGSLDAFKATGHPAIDYPIWKTNVVNARAKFKTLAREELPSQVEAEKAKRASEKAKAEKPKA